MAVCGEMAGDATFAPLLLALGLGEFSLHPNTLLELRRAIRNCDLGALRARAPALLRARDRAEHRGLAGRQRDSRNPIHTGVGALIAAQAIIRAMNA